MGFRQSERLNAIRQEMSEWRTRRMEQQCFVLVSHKHMIRSRQETEGVHQHRPFFTFSSRSQHRAKQSRVRIHKLPYPALQTGQLPAANGRRSGNFPSPQPAPLAAALLLTDFGHAGHQEPDGDDVGGLDVAPFPLHDLIPASVVTRSAVLVLLGGPGQRVPGLPCGGKVSGRLARGAEQQQRQQQPGEAEHDPPTAAAPSPYAFYGARGGTPRSAATAPTPPPPLRRYGGAGAARARDGASVKEPVHAHTRAGSGRLAELTGKFRGKVSKRTWPSG
ncbi:hypothetical protein AOLI_G00287960 [Acnodon oligacanthus]